MVEGDVEVAISEAIFFWPQYSEWCFVSEMVWITLPR